MYTTEDQILIESRVANEKKSAGAAYFLWFFLGFVSAHRFYLGKPVTAILQILSYFVVIGFVWWLVAAATGPEAYATFLSVATSWFGYLVAIGLTWAFFQHMFSGLRHFVLDIGAGYELKVNRTAALVTMAGSLLITFAIWAPILLRAASKGAQ